MHAWEYLWEWRGLIEGTNCYFVNELFYQSNIITSLSSFCATPRVEAVITDQLRDFVPNSGAFFSHVGYIS
jgi:hypothetical protein